MTDLFQFFGRIAGVSTAGTSISRAAPLGSGWAVSGWKHVHDGSC